MEIRWKRIGAVGVFAFALLFLLSMMKFPLPIPSFLAPASQQQQYNYLNMILHNLLLIVVSSALLIFLFMRFWAKEDLKTFARKNGDGAIGLAVLLTVANWYYLGGSLFQSNLWPVVISSAAVGFTFGAIVDHFVRWF